jgi:hypothetical protein
MNTAKVNANYGRFLVYKKNASITRKKPHFSKASGKHRIYMIRKALSYKNE